MKKLRRASILLVAAAVSLWFAPAAQADGIASANWAGYAAHRAGVRFRSVSSEWRVPAASCRPGSPRYSALWVGLGGFATNSAALEQTGTEVDCAGSGRARYFAWYELIPSAPHSISLRVRRRDLVRAAVGVSGRRVTIALEDLTSHSTFWRSFYPRQIDSSSADWIVEAPSECNGSGQCLSLPLADFGQATFLDARAVTAGGLSGVIGSGMWNSTEIALLPHGPRLFAGTTDSPAGAIPSALTNGGSAFSVTYEARPAGSSAPPASFGAPRAGLIR